MLNDLKSANINFMNNQCTESNVTKFINLHIKPNELEETKIIDNSDSNNQINKPIIKIKRVKNVNYFGQVRYEQKYNIFNTKIAHGFGFIQ